MKKGRMKRFWVYTLVYVLVTIMAALSTLAIEAILPKPTTDSGSAITPPVTQTAGEKLLNNVLSLGGANVELSLDLYENTEAKQTYSTEVIEGVLPKVRLRFAGSINIADLQNVAVSGTLQAVISGSEINIQIAYLNKHLYISNESMDIKIETASFSKIMQILPTLGLNLDLGMDFGALDTNQLLANFQSMEAVEQENGDYQMTLDLMEGISLNILTDSEYNIKSVVANKLALGNMTANLTAGLEKDETVEVITPKEEESYVDITKTLNIMDSISEIMQNKKLHLDLAASYAGEMNFGVSGALDVDYSKVLNAYADLNLNINGNSQPIALGCLGDTLLVDFGGMKFMADKADLLTVGEWLAKSLGAATDSNAGLIESLGKMLPFDIDKILNGDLSNININNLLQFSQGEDNVIILTINGAAVGVDAKIEVVIELDENDQFSALAIRNLAVAGGVVNVRVVYSSEVLFPDIDESEYYVINNLSSLLPALSRTAESVLGSKSVSLDLNANVSVKGVEVDAKGKVTANFADTSNLSVYANLAVTAMNKTFDIRLAFIKDTIYVSIDELNFTATVADLGDLVSAISAIMGESAGASVQAAAAAASLSILDKFEGMDINEILAGLIKSIETTNTTFAVTLNGETLGLDSDLVISLGYGYYANEFSVSGFGMDGITANFTAKLTDAAYSFDVSQYEYISLANADALATAVANTITEIKTNKTATLGVEANLVFNGKNISLAGSVAYDNGLLYADITATVDTVTLPIKAYYANDTIYADVSGLKVALSVADIMDLIAGLTGNTSSMEINLPFDIDAIMAGDLSSLSLNFISTLSIGETATNLTINKTLLGTTRDITIRLNYTNGAITGVELGGIEISGISASLNATLGLTANIPDLNTAEYSNLGNITKFVPAVMSFVDEITTTKTIALNTGITLQQGDKNYGLRGLIYANLSKLGAEFDIADLDIYAKLNIQIEDKTYSVEARLVNGNAYVALEKLRVRASVSSLREFVDSIMQLLPNKPEIDTSFVDEMLAGSRIEAILGGDYSVINGEMIKAIELTENAMNLTLSNDVINTENDWRITINYGENLNGVSISDFARSGYAASINLNVVSGFIPEAIVESEYEDISGLKNVLDSVLKTVDKIKTNKTVAVDLGNIELVIDGKKLNIVGEIYADFGAALERTDNGWNFDYKKLKGYANLTVIVEEGGNHCITVHLDGERIYLTYNNLKLSVGMDKIDSLIDVINQMKFITESLQTANLNEVTIQQLIDEAKAQTKDETIPTTSEFDVFGLLKKLLPNLDFEAIMNGDLSGIDLGWLVGISANETAVSLTLDKSFFGLNDDLIISMKYNDCIESLSVSNIAVAGIVLNNLNVSLYDNMDIPTIVSSEYSSLDSVEQFMNSMLKTAVEVVDNKHISFGLKTELVHESVEADSNNVPTKATLTNIVVKDSSCAKFDWNGAYENDGTTNKFVLKKMKAYINFDVTTVTETYYYNNGVRAATPSKSVTREHAIEITYIDNVIYIKYNKMLAKISGDSIKQIVLSVCQILGVEGVNEDLFNNIMALINSTKSEAESSSILDRISPDLIKSFTLSDTQLNGVFDLSSLGLGIDSLNNLNLNVTYNENGMDTLVIRNLKIGTNTVDSVNIGLREFTPISGAPQGDYIDLSNVGAMLTAVQNTLEFSDFEFNGNIKLKISVIGINLDWDIPLNIKVKLVNGGFEASMKLGAIPVVAGVNDDAPYEFGNTVSGGSPAKDRILNMYIKDSMVYMHRTEKVPVFASSDKTYEKKVKVHLDTFMGNALDYLLKYGFGFSDKIMTEIYKAVTKERVNPIDYSNLLKGFSSSGDVNILTLNLKELAENDKLDTMSLGLRSADYNGKPIIGGIILDVYMPVAGAVDITIKSNELTHINVGQLLDMSAVDDYAKNYTYREGAKWDAYNGAWQQSSQEKYTLTFETGSSQSIASMSGVAGDSCMLPTPNSFVVDDGKTHKEYTFAGWYASKDYDESTIYDRNVYPRKNTTLYAKWNESVTEYVTIDFVTNNSEISQDSLKVLAGAKLELPLYTDLMIIETEDSVETRQFDGWYIDAELTTKYASDSAPCTGITLYAKWSVIDMAEAHTVNVYDDGTLVFTRKFIEGKQISVSGLDKFNDNTKYFVDATCTTEVSDWKMGSSDMNIYIKNKYTAIIKSDYGKIVDGKFTDYQGSVVSGIVAQENYYEDDGKQIERVEYTFGGYYVNGQKINDINNYVLPNYDVEIVAQWSKYIRPYVTVSFDVSWVKPGAWKDKNSDFSGNVTKMSGTSAPASFRVLVDSKISINASDYPCECVYKYTAIWVSDTYKFRARSWRLNAPYQTYLNTNTISDETEYTILSDTVFYPVWEHV